MKLKNGTSIFGLRSEILLAFLIADKVFSKYHVECVLTSGTDSKHGRASLHYVGLAIDLRTRDFANDAEVELAAKDLRDALNDEYDVVVEKNHIHVEYQPK